MTKDNTPSLREQAERFPKEPGIYFFRNARGKILYIGKAKNLRNRIFQYIRKTDGRRMISRLLNQSKTIDFTITQTEKQALILEAKQIQEHKPKFNVQLLDGRAFLHFHLDETHDFPALSLTRFPKPRKNHRYFGPYVDSTAARDTMEIINKNFQLRTCSDETLKREKRPCLEYYIHRCLAPCAERCSGAEYSAEIERVLAFLGGDQQQVLDKMTSRMTALSLQERFEDAMEVHEQRTRIERLLSESQQTTTQRKDRDYWGIEQVGHVGVYAVSAYRRGEMRPVITRSFNDVIEETPEEMLCSLLSGWYVMEAPHEIVVPFLPVSHDILEEVLSERVGRQVKIVVPQRGDRLEKLNLAHKNARAKYKQVQDEASQRKNLLMAFKRVANLRQTPFRIECFDNSHLGGTMPVSAMVVFQDGKPNKHAYRRFLIKEAEGGDDYGGMREVLYRRFKRGLSKNNQGWELPQLLIVDGGKGQLNVAMEVLDELDVTGVDVIGVVKPRTHRKRGDTEMPDRIVSPDLMDPVQLEKGDPVLLFLQRIRDEAHNTAVSYQKKQREKHYTRSDLDDVSGVGSKTKKALLQHFGSVKAIAAASPDELTQVEGVGESLAERIVKHFSQLDKR